MGGYFKEIIQFRSWKLVDDFLALMRIHLAGVSMVRRHFELLSMLCYTGNFDLDDQMVDFRS